MEIKATVFIDGKQVECVVMEAGISNRTSEFPLEGEIYSQPSDIVNLTFKIMSPHMERKEAENILLQAHYESQKK